MLKIFYSSGSEIINTFEKQPSKSIGGLITSKEITSFLNSIFGNISLNQIYNGSDEYRCIFLKNTDTERFIQNIRLYLEYPYIITDQTNPELLNPNEGDKYLIPSNAIGLWAGYDGYIATFSNIGVWTFTTDTFGKYSFAIENVPQLIDNGLSTPFGLEFTEAYTDDYGITGFLNIGNLLSNETIGLWIKRVVIKQDITNKMFLSTLTQEGKHLEIIEEIPFEFSYDLYNSYEINYIDSTSTEFNIDIEYPLMFNIAISKIGEKNYSDLSIIVIIKWQTIVDNTKLNSNADFMLINYTDISKFANFYTTDNFNENVVLNTIFYDIGIYTFQIKLYDNDKNVEIANFEKILEVI